METFTAFFENMTSLQKLGWIFLCLAITWLLEFSVPLARADYKKWRHAGRNLVFLSTSLVINLLFGLATVGVFLWLSTHHFGVLNLVDLNPWVELLVAVLALDFVAQWFAHYLLHRIKWMWKFHLVHHSDTMVDATTGTRHHPGDYLIREVFSLATIVVFGIPLGFYLFYRIATIFFTYFTHANIALPDRVDKALSWVFVTPNMHKFHHHFERPWTDTNFGNIFSIWDRLMGTLVYDDPRKVRYGVDVLDDKLADNLGYQFSVPFDKGIKTDY
ncbi:MAG: sterol desaturase [Bacteroidetes bacterium]|nr:MAG: sterol desaturase [Bacteroidota bacterium]PTM11091.1 MAG: sterol desaturase [Bacteroidota bacterium]